MARRSSAEDRSRREMEALRLREEGLSTMLKTRYEEIQREEAFEIMMSGLEGRASPVVEASEAALIATGHGFQLRLQEVLDSHDSSTVVRKRVRGILPAISQLSEPSPDAAECFLKVLFTAGRHGHSEVLAHLYPLSQVMRREQLCSTLVIEALDHTSNSRHFRLLIYAAEMTRDRPSTEVVQEIMKLYFSRTGSVFSSCKHLLDTIAALQAGDGTGPKKLPMDIKRLDELTPKTIERHFRTFFFEMSDPMWKMGYHCCPPGMIEEATRRLDSAIPPTVAVAG